MLSNFKQIVGLTNQLVRNCELRTNFLNENLLKTVICEFCRGDQKKSFHTNSPRMSEESVQKRKAVKGAQRKDEGIQGADSFEVDLLKSKEEYFPTVDLPTRLFDGIPFKDLPVVVINASRNNTILGLTVKGETRLTRSCGQEGFKNSRKGTNIAGQTAGNSLALRAVKRGFKIVRVVLRGLGPGRLSAIKGLQLGGLNVVSITDDTADATTNRPRKQRRL